MKQEEGSKQKKVSLGCLLFFLNKEKIKEQREKDIFLNLECFVSGKKGEREGERNQKKRAERWKKRLERKEEMIKRERKY